MKPLAAFAAGLLFGCGLALSGMTDPRVVLGFLDVAGAWNPALGFVMAGAVPVVFLGYRATFAHPRPVLAERFDLPTTRRPDVALLIGSVLFGIGWGIAGWCPGPAIASLSGASPGLGAFLGGLLLGLGAIRLARSQNARRR